jgi:hypothetical protein
MKPQTTYPIIPTQLGVKPDSLHGMCSVLASKLPNANAKFFLPLATISLHVVYFHAPARHLLGWLSRPSFCVSIYVPPGWCWRNFPEIWHWIVVSKVLEKLQFSFKSGSFSDYFTRKPTRFPGFIASSKNHTLRSPIMQRTHTPVLQIRKIIYCVLVIFNKFYITSVILGLWRRLCNIINPLKTERSCFI